MTSSASSSPCRTTKNPKLFKLDLEGNVYCNHDKCAVLRVAGRRSSRNGAEFYGCPLWPKADCGFFMWKEDLQKVIKEQCSCKGSGIGKYENMMNEYLEVQNKMLMEKNQYLMMLLDKNQDLEKTKCLSNKQCLLHVSRHVDVHVSVD